MKNLKVLLSEDEIRSRVADLGREITADYRTKQDVVVVGILKGSFMFFADLIREFDFAHNCEFMGVSSYGDKTNSSGEVKITLDMNEPLTGKHVILIEDIMD